MSNPTVTQHDIDRRKETAEAQRKAQEEFFAKRAAKYNGYADEADKRKTKSIATIAGEENPNGFAIDKSALEAMANGEEPLVEQPVLETQEEPVVEEQEDYSRLVTRVVGGRRITKSLADWLLLADSAETQTYQQTVRQQAPPIEIPEIDDEAIARDIALGDPETSTAAVKKLRQAVKDEVQLDLLRKQMNLNGQTIMNGFLKEYPEIAKDRMLYDLLVKKDKDLAEDGTVYGSTPEEVFHNRLRVAGDAIMKWKTGQAQQDKTAALNDKKKTIRNLSNINSKQVQTPQKTLSEAEARDLAVKQMMANRRKRMF